MRNFYSEDIGICKTSCKSTWIFLHEKLKTKKYSGVWDSNNVVFSIFYSKEKKLEEHPSPSIFMKKRLKANFGAFFFLFEAVLNIMQ